MDRAEPKATAPADQIYKVMRSNEETKQGEVEQRLAAHARGLSLFQQNSKQRFKSGTVKSSTGYAAC